MSRRRSRVTVAALIGALLLGTPAHTARAAGCAALDYLSTVGMAEDALRQSPPDVVAARRDVSGLLAADATRSAALQPIAADLTVQPPDTGDAEQRLESMRAVLAYPAGSTCNEDGSAARGTLRGVYASPAFRHLDDVAQSNLLSSLLHLFGALVGRAAGALGQVGGVVLVVALVVLALIIGVRRWRSAAQTRAPRPGEPSTMGDDPDGEWQAAERAAAGGDFREAVRRAFRSALLDVAVRGAVFVDAAWTTRELLERCNADGDVLVALAGAAALFDRAWYSGVAVTRADWELAADRCGALRRLARVTRAVRR